MSTRKPRPELLALCSGSSTLRGPSTSPAPVLCDSSFNSFKLCVCERSPIPSKCAFELGCVRWNHDIAAGFYCLSPLKVRHAIFQRESLTPTSLPRATLGFPLCPKKAWSSARSSCDRAPRRSLRKIASPSWIRLDALLELTGRYEEQWGEARSLPVFTEDLKFARENIFWHNPY